MEAVHLVVRRRFEKYSSTSEKQQREFLFGVPCYSFQETWVVE